MEIGSKIKFGPYDWDVLDIQSGHALIITDRIIENRSYHNVYCDITWAECSLRAYLNHEFLEKFSQEEQQKIITVENQNPGNEWYGTDGGKNTTDRIFVLSVEEVVCRYFGDSSSLLYQKGKNQRYWFERKDPNNAKRTAIFMDKEWCSWWWLRTPGRVGIKAAYVHGNGDIGIQGNNILKGNVADGYCMGGVRPAMWIQI